MLWNNPRLYSRPPSLFHTVLLICRGRRTGRPSRVTNFGEVQTEVPAPCAATLEDAQPIKQRKTAMPHSEAPIQKDKRLSIRLTEEQKALLEQAAQAQHISVNQFVLQASLDAAHSVLADPLDQTHFHLPHDQWQAFCQSLDQPPQINPALQQLFSE
jgi:uncharacterized protein (DUF1778 family)